MGPKAKEKKKRKAHECDDYGSAAYWEKRYSTKAGFHNWYYKFDDLLPLFAKSLAGGAEERGLGTCRVLEIGCGDSPLVDGFCEYSVKQSPSIPRLYGIDIATNVIEHLNKCQPQSTKGELMYQAMDATSLAFLSESFDLVIDKGTADALLCEANEIKKTAVVKRMLTEAVRVIVPNGGSLVVVSHMQPDSDQWEHVLSSCLLPALASVGAGDLGERVWTLDSHAGSSAHGRAAVHIARSTLRRVSKRLGRRPSGTSAGLALTMAVHEYSDNDDDDE